MKKEIVITDEVIEACKLMEPICLNCGRLKKGKCTDTTSICEKKIQLYNHAKKIEKVLKKKGIKHVR